MHRKVVFLGKQLVEKLEPVGNAVVISISDSSMDEAKLKHGWASVHRFYFIDAGYDEKSLRFVGPNYKYIYASYFNRDIAIAIRTIIADSVSSGVDTFVVNCHAGQSRSAAIAMYLHDQYGYLPFNSYRVLSSLQDSGLVPNFDALSKYNRMVYALLQNPNLFDKVINEIERTEVSVPEDRSLMKRFFGWLRR